MNDRRTDSRWLVWCTATAVGIAQFPACSRDKNPIDFAHSSRQGSQVGTVTMPGKDERRAAPKSLAEAEAMARRAFEEFLDVDELIYPKGWVKRRTPVLESSHEIVESADAKVDQAGPAAGIVRIKFQEHSSVVHNTEEEAAADEELFTCPPATTRAEMERAQSEKPFDPVVVEIHYESFDDGLQRKAWSTTPKITRGATWLDRLGVP